MAMYKSLFDLSPEQTASTAMPRTVVFSNGTGSGSMTICPLFLGAELYYNDMHLAFFEEAPAPARNVIEINHCRVGRYECSFGEIAAAIWRQGILPSVQQRAKSRPPAFRCGTTTASPSYWIWMRFRRKCGNKWNGTA